MSWLLWWAQLARRTGNEVNKAKTVLIVGRIMQSCDPTEFSFSVILTSIMS